MERKTTLELVSVHNRFPPAGPPGVFCSTGAGKNRPDTTASSSLSPRLGRGAISTWLEEVGDRFPTPNRAE